MLPLCRSNNNHKDVRFCNIILALKWYIFFLIETYRVCVRAKWLLGIRLIRSITSLSKKSRRIQQWMFPWINKLFDFPLRFTLVLFAHVRSWNIIVKTMEVCSNESKAVPMEELCWALQIGDLDKVKEQLQRLNSENTVTICPFKFITHLIFIQKL